MAGTGPGLRLLFAPVVMLVVCLSAPSWSAGAGLRADVDVRLLIDASAGMGRADPDAYRVTAVDLALRMLPEGAHAGIWVFADQVREVVPPGEVDNAWRRRALAALAAAIENGGGSYRDIPGAVQAALPGVDVTATARRTSLVLLTDGRVDIAPSPVRNAGVVREMLSDLAPQLAKRKVPVNTVALSDRADVGFLEAFAEATGGLATHAAEPRDLPARFLQVIERVVPLSRLPVRDGGFQVDPGVRSFSLLLEGEPGTELVRSPPGGAAGESAPGSRKDFGGGAVTAYTVDNPAGGLWELRSDASPSAVVLVRSDFRVVLDAAPFRRVPAGEATEITLRPEKDGEILQDTSQPTLEARMTGPGEFARDFGPADFAALPDGGYRLSLPGLDSPGEYRLSVVASLGEVRREAVLFLAAVAPSDQPTLVTRGETPLRDEFRLPLILLAVSIAVGLLILWIVLRRRKRRKLDIWRRRAEQLHANGHSGVSSSPDAARPGAEP